MNKCWHMIEPLRLAEVGDSRDCVVYTVENGCTK